MSRPMEYYRPKRHASLDAGTQRDRRLFIQNYKPANMNYMVFRKLIWDIIRKTGDNVDYEVKRRIKMWVPKANGNLRESLTDSLNSPTKYSENNFRYNFILGSGMSHIRYANEMSLTQLRHPNSRESMRYIYYNRNNVHSRRYGHWVTLVDREAITHFYETLVRYGRRQLRRALRDNINNVVSRFRLRTHNGVSPSRAMLALYRYNRLGEI